MKSGALRPEASADLQFEGDYDPIIRTVQVETAVKKKK